ncbi:hybrid sensor histidine kinase/response regulator [Desulfurivibrio alkaliphilus]|uniref:histidine kinase n=1 Tax=Desulfurivibrio alkaliphilus (strain DSM 19089 / UNIQEM U267 / AHT2) TaxID=589865 RepID=D6Z6I2_DESAT|nr:ATP-binding protein [Desulfurivibrio alkaliphilus]ADH84941.1 signal transduction histidine kinase, nitrogen specific, NtrB [Desulfurivibrio alkaliphilus AHT 2]
MDNRQPRPKILQALALSGLAALLGLFLWWFHHREAATELAAAHQAMAATNSLKTGQIEQWRQERLADAARMSRGLFAEATAAAWLQTPEDQQAVMAVKHRLQLQKAQGYADVLLVNAAGDILLSATGQEETLPEASRRSITAALTTGQVTLSPFFRADDREVYLDTVAAVPAAVDPVLLVLRTPARDFFEPLLQFWPETGIDFRTFIIYPYDQELHTLCDCTINPDKLAKRDLEAIGVAPAALTELYERQGKFAGNYRDGTPMLADLRLVPDTDWLLVTSRPTSEILSETYYRTGLLGLVIVLGLLFTALLQHRRQADFFRRLYHSERTRREAEQEFRTTLYSIGDAVITTDNEGRVRAMNRVAEQLTGWLEDEARGQELPKVFRIINQDSRVTVANPVAKVLHEGKVVGLANHTLLISRDGSERPIADSGAPIRDDEGNISGVVLVFSDQTEAHATREALHKSQRLESMGLLAGGVAHDFNNKLAVIIGYAQVLQLRLPPEDPLQGEVGEIITAGRRSADLVRQLLAFARKQTINPKLLNINEEIEGTIKMLGRLIGQHITLTWQPGEELWPMYLDPGQLDQILANLAVNARDAIGNERPGEIVIATKRVAINEEFCRFCPDASPGQYVRLEVRDNGCGMDDDTLGRIFDPFYTTKEIGKGTGLGLATIYGIVRQNKGFMEVFSSPGHGTTFRIYLPRFHGPAPENAVTAGAAAELLKAVGQETILLVEDEVSLLNLIHNLLTMLGYHVLPVADPRQALRLADDQPGEIHLLLTDLAMPGLSGLELARRLQAKRPQLKILFISGHPLESFAELQEQGEEINFLQKPFSREELATKVRQVLGRS